MAIIEVYVGITAQLIKVKCRTKDKRDVVARAARKTARGLGGPSGTPLLLRKMTGEADSPVASLRLSKVAVEEMVLVAEDTDGIKVGLCTHAYKHTFTHCSNVCAAPAKCGRAAGGAADEQQKLHSAHPSHLTCDDVACG